MCLVLKGHCNLMQTKWNITDLFVINTLSLLAIYTVKVLLYIEGQYVIMQLVIKESFTEDCDTLKRHSISSTSNQKEAALKCGLAVEE